MKSIRRDDWESLKPTVCGWGINDVNYPTSKSEKLNGRWVTIWTCPYYRKWCGILRRCFDYKYQTRNPSYRGCTVCEEWRYLSNFIKWVDSQPNKDWMNCEPDKDFLSVGNKQYSPEHVVFISEQLNKFITDSSNTRGCLMIGVNLSGRKKNPYVSSCRDPFTGKKDYIGVYFNEIEAHLAWQERKHHYACQLADLQPDSKVAKALRERYAPDKDWKNR